MRPFLIDDKVIARIAALARHAEKNPFSMDHLLDLYNKQGRPAGDFDEFTLTFPFGYRLVYSVEKQVPGDVRHMSMSVDEAGKLPNTEVVREVIKMLGFTKELHECIVRIEPLSENREAINVLEIITP